MAGPWPLKNARLSPQTDQKPEPRLHVPARLPSSVVWAMVETGRVSAENGRLDGVMGARVDLVETSGLVRSGCRGLVGSMITSQHLHRVSRPGQALAAFRRTLIMTGGPPSVCSTHERRLSPRSIAPTPLATGSDSAKGTDHVQL
jgi:hypothetical protein